MAFPSRRDCGATHFRGRSWLGDVVRAPKEITGAVVTDEVEAESAADVDIG